MDICTTVATINKLVFNPLLALIFAVGLLIFVVGIIEFLWGLGNETDGKEKGKQHMLWGVYGVFIMVAAWGLIKIIAGVVGGKIMCG